MISAIPPPRPVSVNSLARTPAPSAVPYQKTSRSTSTGIELPDGHNPPSVIPAKVEDDTSVDTEMDDAPTPPNELMSSCRSNIRFQDLPPEIHDAIIDHLFGERASTFTTSAPGKLSACSWSKAFRHPRRKALSNLALISPVWRPLVQSRIYRHIKIKGTIEGLRECSEWFCANPHLAPYVRHIEFWVPVWGNRTGKNGTPHLPPIRRYNYNEDAGLANAAAVLQVTMAWDDSDTNSASSSSHSYSSYNASLEDLFSHVKMFFSEARILTIEGGHCKKPPMIRHFRNDPSGRSGRERLELLPNIQTFVMRGAWNIMRNYQHWCNISQALPNLREWHCAYAKPKIEGYNTMSRILSRLSTSLLHVNISLEGFYNKDNTQSSWFGDMSTEPHLCTLLGQVAPRLESLAFTGKVCACLFTGALACASSMTSVPRLKSLDLVVKTCCREKPVDATVPLFDDASGITNLNFIRSFERLVIAAIQSLAVFTELNYIRIRFIDLDSICPLLNPYFQLVDNICTGLWSGEILEALHEARPEAHFVELSDGIYPQHGPNRHVIGAIYPRTRPLSIQTSTYKVISDATKP